MSRRHTRKAIVVEQISWHPNGVYGAPFHAVTFQFEIQGQPIRNLVGVVFEHAHHVAVFDRDALGRGEIGFGGISGGRNDWRGDQFEPELRRAIEILQTSQSHGEAIVGR